MLFLWASRERPQKSAMSKTQATEVSSQYDQNAEIKYGIRDPSCLKPHPYSVRLYRQRTPKNRFIEDIAENLERPLIINENDELIDGVRRWLAISQLDWDRVDVVQRSFASIEEEKQAILRHNDDRDETFTQKIRVALEYEELVAPILERRMKAGKPIGEQEDDPLLESNEGLTALELAADRVGWGQTKFWQAKTIWKEKESGHRRAEKLVKQLVADELTVNAAYESLNKEKSESDTEVPNEQRGTLLAEGVPVDLIEADIKNPEQASFVVSSNNLRRMLLQIKLPSAFNTEDWQFIHLEASGDGLSLNTVVEMDSIGKTQEIRARYVFPPRSFSQLTSQTESIGISLLIGDLLSYLDILNGERIRVQFHGESGKDLGSALYLTNGDIPLCLKSVRRWSQDSLECPGWIPEEVNK